MFEPKEEHSTLYESQVSTMDQGEDGDTKQLKNGGIYYFCTFTSSSRVTSVVEFEGAEMIDITYFYPHLFDLVKFRYSEKATQFFEITTLDFAIFFGLFRISELY